VKLKKILGLISFIIVLGVSCADAVELTVVDGTMTSAVENQMPVDQIESYPADFGKLYCFTRIVGAQKDTEITHVWYYQDNEMARVSLSVRSSNWRTYSSKRFLPQWAGEWKVVILDEEENEIAAILFSLE